MLTPHGTLVAVIDGENLELYRNGGDEARPRLSPLPAPKLEGHSRDSGKRHRSSAANPDDQLAEEDSFIAAVAKWLNHEAIEGALDRLVVVAAPRALGELRRHYHRELVGKILAEIDKDLVGRPPAELEAALLHAKAS